MKLAAATLMLLALAIPALGQGCNLPSCHNLGSVSIWDGNGGPLLTGHTYIFRIMSVPAGETLTVQPGAILKFEANPIYRASIAGTLRVLGTSSQPVIITSIRDDVGGDHNGDGSATSPARGNWSGLTLSSNSTDCDLEWCEIRYTRTAINAYGPNTVPLDMRHVTTRHTTYDGFYSNNARPGIVDSCHFEDGQYPVRNLRYSDVDNFVSCTASGNSMGDDLRLTDVSGQTVTWYGSSTWTPANTMNGSGVVIVYTNVNLHATASLTLGAGMVIKMDDPSIRQLDVFGTLTCNGSPGSPVIFTSIADDTAGGDSENDGPTTGTPGDWRGLTFQSGSDASALTWTEVRYAAGPSGALDTLLADITLTSCRFADSAGFGLRVGGGTTVTGCSFENNQTAISPVAITYLPNFSSNTASGNASGDVLALGTGTLSTAATLSGSAAFNGTNTFALRGTVTVSGSGALTIDPGVVIKGDPATGGTQLQVYGALHAGTPGGAPVVFTSFLDDTYGGDTNSDGSATSPSPGDWFGLRFQYSADASTLENVIVRYAGRGASASVWLDHCDMTIEGVSIEYGAGPGLRGGGSLATVTGCAFDYCDVPLADFDLEAVAGLVSCTAQGSTQSDVIRIGDGDVNGALTIAPSNTLNSNGVLILDDRLNAAGDLTLEAGMIIKFSTGATYGATATGTLTCNGTAAQPVVFTSLPDDAFGGDSGGDGPTAGSAGDWDSVDSGFGMLTATHTHFRFGGGGSAMAAIEGGGLDLTDCVIEESARHGVDLRNDVNGKTVTNCHFAGTSTPITRASLTGLPNLSGNTATGSRVGDFIRVTVRGATTAPATTIETINTINGNGVLHIFGLFGLWNATIVGPGVVFKFHPGAGLRSTAAASLTVNGSAAGPVVFTSHHDDSVGAPDNDPTSPQKGDWVGLEFLSQGPGASSISGAVVRYAGESGAPGVDLDDADVAFCDLLVEDCLGVALDASFNSSPVLKNPTFLNNCGSAIDGITWAVLANMTGATAIGNGAAAGYLNATTITSDVVEGNLTIERDNYFGDCIVVTVSPNLTPTGTLSFGRGVVVKCLPGVTMNVNSIEATAYETSTFTSIKDDSIAGDTNGDGNATTPAPGDWDGIDVQLGSPVVPDIVEHALVRYADIGVERTLNARSSRAEFCNQGFFLGYFTSYPFNGVGHNLIAFANTGIGIRGGRVYNCTSADNGTYGFDCNKAVYSIAWNNVVDDFTYTSDEVLGPSGTDAVYCCGTSLSVGPPTGGPPSNPNSNCGSSGWGNIDVDPQFVDEVNGDLRLGPTSPVRNYVLQPCPQSILMDTSICKPWGASGQGYPEDPAVTRDFDDGPRPADDDLGGPAAFVADLGAHERRTHELVVLGDMELGAATTTVIGGPPGQAGAATYLFGLSGPDIVIPGWGVLHIDPNTIIGTLSLPLPALYVINAPSLPLLAGLDLDIQAIVVVSGEPVGMFTEIFRGRFHD